MMHGNSNIKLAYNYQLCYCCVSTEIKLFYFESKILVLQIDILRTSESKRWLLYTYVQLNVPLQPKLFMKLSRFVRDLHELY